MTYENGKREVQMMKLKFQMVRWRTWTKFNKVQNGNRYLSIVNRSACLRVLSRRLTADITSLLDRGAQNVSRAENRTGAISPSPRKTRRELVQKCMLTIASSEVEKVGRLSQYW